MNWKLIESGSLTGQENMDLDVELATHCSNNEAYFRLYRWTPYCITLGANQKFDDINLEKSKKDGIDVVKRPTGGRAILHAEEITYSVVIPLSCGMSPKEIYAKISNSLVRGLIEYDNQLAEHIELENVQPNFPDLLKDPSGVLCFASTAKSEVKFDSKKIIGSAQRKMGNTVLQHGSILCGSYHQKLADYLNVDDVLKKLLKEELSNKTVELESILKNSTDYDKLAEGLVQGFEKDWNISFKTPVSH